MRLEEFLLARIAEDEVAAREAPSGRWHVTRDPLGVHVETNNVNMRGRVLMAVGDDHGHPGQGAEHIARWDPARVLAECEAKRRLVKLHAATHYCIPQLGHASTGQWYESDSAYPWPCPTLALLALPYVSHPDYREGWRP